MQVSQESREVLWGGGGRLASWVFCTQFCGDNTNKRCHGWGHSSVAAGKHTAQQLHMPFLWISYVFVLSLNFWNDLLFSACYLREQCLLHLHKKWSMAKELGRKSCMCFGESEASGEKKLHEHILFVGIAYNNVLFSIEWTLIRHGASGKKCRWLVAAWNTTRNIHGVNIHEMRFNMFSTWRSQYT